ncbi:MAG: translocation/assembly module TamB domain-containing protein, partial [Lysobacteraceae bacterium]
MRTDEPISDNPPATPPVAPPQPKVEREARIAELRARRRARLRWLAIRGGLSLAALAVGVAVLLYWLLNTLGGRDVLLRQIVARLPEGDALTWSRAEGPASGPMTLHDVRYVHRACPDRGGEPVAYPGCAAPLETVFTAQAVALDPALRPLLGRRLRLDALAVRGATLSLPKDDTPFELPRWPGSLPAIAPPLAMEADAIVIDGLAVKRAGEAVIDVRRLRGGLHAETGRLHVEHLDADTDRGRFTLHGDYVPADRYRMDLTAGARLPAAAGRTPATLGFVARGDLRALDIALSGRAPGPVSARLHLVGEDTPRWTFAAKADALTLAALTGTDDDASPYVFDLRANGTGGRATVQGRVAQDTFVATVQPSTVTVEHQTLLLAPLAIDVLGGHVRADGRADFTVPADARFDGRVQARGLRWQGEAKDAVAVTGDGDFKVSGRLRDWTADGNATLVRGDERAQLALQARGDDRAAKIGALRATLPSGRLDASGDVAWSPALRWQADATLAGFDPGYLLPDWRGAVNGALRSTGTTRGDGGLDVRVDADRLGGRLRGRTLGGRAHVLAHLPATAEGRTDGEGTVALTLGGSRVDAKGRIAERFDVDATFAPLHLEDLLPTAQGALRGTLRLTGPRAQPDIAVDLTGNGVRVAGYTAGSLRAQGRLPWRDGAVGALTVDATGVEAGLALQTL